MLQYTKVDKSFWQDKHQQHCLQSTDALYAEGASSCNRPLSVSNQPQLL